jgi:DNA excision repair protein ERCC-6
MGQRSTMSALPRDQVVDQVSAENNTTSSVERDEEISRTYIEATDEEGVLKGLTEGVRNQEDVQRDITVQAQQALKNQEDERDEKRIERAKTNKARLNNQKRLQTQRLGHFGITPQQRTALQDEVSKLEEQILGLEDDIQQTRERMRLREAEAGAANDDSARGDASKRQPGESLRDFLIRTGKITPFDKMTAHHMEEGDGELGQVLLEAEVEAEEEAYAQSTKANAPEERSHQFLRKPGFAKDETPQETDSDISVRAAKKRRTHVDRAVTSTEVSEGEFSEAVSRPKHAAKAEESFSPSSTDSENNGSDAAYEDVIVNHVGRKLKAANSRVDGDTETEEAEKIVDDGNEALYQKRVNAWIVARSAARSREPQRDLNQMDPEEEEWFKPSPHGPDYTFANGLKLPGDIHPALYNYQLTGVRWLSELWNTQTGGIVGDEMGLGKTIQVIAFIAALHYSKQLKKPVIVVAPATVLLQWVKEFQTWWPPLRVSILHTSGAGMVDVQKESRIEESDEDERGSWRQKKVSKNSKAAKRIVDRVLQHGHVLVTTYAGIQTYGHLLVPVEWQYAVLDEGHKIRNPNAAVTLYAKELKTPNRIILSGTPLQNNLIELWSLFDFIYPMRLGTLITFRNQFEIPIKLGGYANATQLQIRTADKTAEALKETIAPFLLQRLKVDVASDLPRKTEQVLFCKLTKPQRQAYEAFLASDDMKSILNRTRQSLYGIDILRKICNHPDLLDPALKKKPGYKWGNPTKSGKMQVVRALVEMWKKKGDKTLIFSQGVQMLNIIEDFVKDIGNLNYLRMDGSTPIKNRQELVNQFNDSPEYDVFLLTTKVGGLGVNLTGANRVIIFDPDWNPSTDVQARERAWRLGQKKEVTIYRLMTAGTIEEKIYHRQIFKQFLADKILKDPKQRQTFHMKDLYDLFILGASDEAPTETSELFQGTEVNFRNKSDGSGRLADPNKDSSVGTTTGIHLSQGSAVATRDPTTNLASGTSSREAAARDVLAPIDGISKIEDFHDESVNAAPASDVNDQVNEQRIMQGLFARSGIHSVLQHDKIINGRRVIQADRGMVEAEAKRLAAEAAAELRKAGEAAKLVPIGTVTWTGESGTGGRPPPAATRRRGPAAGSVLQGLQDRQLGPGGVSPGSSPGSSRPGTPGPPNIRNPSTKDFVRMIRDYMRVHGGVVPTQMLIVHFDHMCSNEKSTRQFKAALQQVAELKPVPGSSGQTRQRWHLREGFA